MILEFAEFTAAPGQADALAAGLALGAEVIRGAEGCLSVQVSRAVEDPNLNILLILWQTIDDHLVTFRQGPLFPAYRQHINGLFVDTPRVHHFPLDAE